MQRNGFDATPNLEALRDRHHARTDQFARLERLAGRALPHLDDVAGAHVAQSQPHTAMDLLHLEHRPLDQQPLLGQASLVGGQQRAAPSQELLERAAFEQHAVQNQRIGRQLLGGRRVRRMGGEYLGHRVEQPQPRRRHHVLVGLAVQPVHPVGERQSLTAEMALLVLAARPAPARVVAADVGPWRGAMRLQEAHERVVLARPGAAQQSQRAFGVTPIGREPRQIDEHRCPFGVHRLRRRQLTLGELDVPRHLQRHRKQPPACHPRAARHQRRQRLGEQTQRCRRPAHADRLVAQQFGQVGVSQDGGRRRHHGVELVGKHILRIIFGNNGFQYLGHVFVQADQGAQRQRVLGRQVVPLRQHLALLFEAPPVEVESRPGQRVEMQLEPTLGDRLRQRRQRLGEERRVRHAQRPHGLVDGRRLVLG